MVIESVLWLCSIIIMSLKEKKINIQRHINIHLRTLMARIHCVYFTCICGELLASTNVNSQWNEKWQSFDQNQLIDCVTCALVLSHTLTHSFIQHLYAYNRALNWRWCNFRLSFAQCVILTGSIVCKWTLSFWNSMQSDKLVSLWDTFVYKMQFYSFIRIDDHNFPMRQFTQRK